MSLSSQSRLVTEITALHWDLDGTIVNTEELKREAHAKTVAHLGGRVFVSNDFYAALMGTASEPAARAIMKECGINCAYSDYRSVQRMYYHDLVHAHAKAHDGVREIFQLARSHGMRQAIVSSSSRMEIERVLTKTRLSTLVDGIVGVDDVDNPKPKPDPYLKAMQITFGNRKNGRAVEDTDTGVESALAAGLSVVAVRHELNACHVFKGAHQVLHITDMANPEQFFKRLVAP